MTKPVVAQIHGACLGLGAELALACDLRVMADDVKFGLPETKLGLIPDVGGSSRLPAVVGLGIAKELLMTGRTIDAAECHRIGAANRIAPPAELEQVTQELVDELLAASPLAVGLREARRGRGREADARRIARAGGLLPADPGRDRRLPRGGRRLHGEARAALHRARRRALRRDGCRRPRRRSGSRPAAPPPPAGTPRRRYV